MTLTKADIVDRLVSLLSIPRKDAVSHVELIFESIKTSLETTDSVKISGFGTFNVREKHSRRGRNPQTGASMEITERRVVTFKPSQILRNNLNGISNDGITDDDTDDSSL